MAQRNEQVLDRVRQELDRQPELGSRQLFEIAKEMEPAMEENSLAQFHARYVLPIKREHAVKRAEKQGGGAPSGKKAASKKQTKQPDPQPPKKASSRSKKSGDTAEAPSAGQAQPAAAARGGESAEQSSAGREQVRVVLMEFALEVAQAESRTDIVEVLRKVDGYVDKVLQAR